MAADHDDDAAGRFSSPDPLTDDLDIASSTRPPPRSTTTRGRTTTRMGSSAIKPRTLPLQPHDFSDFSLPYNGVGSTPVKSSAMTSRSSRHPSPRKRTFELDVGDERSPQRIYVTVEAEAEAEEAAANLAAASSTTGTASKRGVKRKLFPPSSPTRNVVRGEETTTTSVPLRGLTDDEGNGTETPRKRGRRRKSNGTPIPTASKGQGRKRAGTPVQRKTQPRRNTRSQDDVPESEASKIDDASAMTGLDVEMDVEDAGATPKAKAKKPRIRKTPAKPAASKNVPSSSQAPSSRATGTGRKRGRPRKALMPDELAPLTESEMERSAVGEEHMIAGSEQPSNAMLPAEASIGGGRHDEVQAENHDDEEDLLMLNSTPTPSNFADTQQIDSIRRRSRGMVESSQHPTSEAGYTEEGEGEGYVPMMEQQSDMESEFEPLDGITYGRQDTLAHASDFSMIAVESLPSFQASFQADLSRIPSEGAEQSEMGEETNMIINQTLESLRQSMQADAERQSPDPLSADNDQDGEQSQTGRLQRSSRDLAEGNSRAWSRNPSGSPKKPKQLPLSRQLFSTRAGKAPQVDDSFSTLPDSLLQAATPRHLPMKQTTANGDTSMYDDSFSEIPEAVLEAATPKPPTRTTNTLDNDAPASDNTIERTHSSSRSGRLNLSSSRLPTPDDTSSSNNGSKRAPDEELANAEPQEAEGSNSRGADIPSSPPNHTQSHVIDFGMSLLQRDASGTPEVQKSSPPQLPPSGVAPLERVQSLEPPAHIGRPSLSPIVRVARTLQSVISDRSSPDGRESNLGSPFRSSVSNEPHRQSSVARSPPSHPYHDSAIHSNAPSLFNPIASFTQRLRSSQNRSQRADSPNVIGEVEDPFGPDIHDYTQTESLKRSAYGGNHSTDMYAQQGESAGAGYAAVTSSTGAAPPSDDHMSWMAHGDSPEIQRSDRQPTPQQMHIRSSSFLATHASSTGASRAMDALAIETAGAESERTDEVADDESELEEQEEHDLIDRQFELSKIDEELERDDGDDEDGGGGDLMYDDEEEEDDMDLWDIEASRPTPDEPSSFIAHVVPKPKAEPETVAAQPPRRGRIPSPWRRTNRRLIYKDDVLSPSQIEIEEGAVSEVDDEYEMIPPAASRRTSAVQQRQTQTQTQEHEYEYEQEQEQEQEEEQDGQERLELQEEIEAQSDARDAEVQEDEVEEDDGPYEGDDYDMLAQQSDGDSIAEEEEQEQAPESEGYSMIDLANKNSSPGRSTRDEQYSQVALSDQPDAEAAQENSVHTTEVDEYSLVAQQSRKNNNNSSNKPAAQEQEKAKRKSGFFGGFDILSFFSSPATLPKTRPEESPNPAAAAAAEASTASNMTRASGKLAQPKLGNNNSSSNNSSFAKQSQPSTSTLWSNGLFPSIPQKEFRPSPERRVDLFSPGPASALRSADTDDDNERSLSVSTPSRSPSPSRPLRSQPTRLGSSSAHRSPAAASTRSVSAAPSTPPEKTQTYYPSIEQKRNFTPHLRQQQSPASSLFAPRTNNAHQDNSNNNNRVNFLQVPTLQLQNEDYYQQQQHQQNHHQESSILTDGTDYERVPPRDKPSQWDRTLSPSKSCFRSPLKPTTPGRVVAFSNAANPNASIESGSSSAGGLLSLLGNGSSGSGSSSGNGGGRGKGRDEFQRFLSPADAASPSLSPGKATGTGNSAQAQRQVGDYGLNRHRNAEQGSSSTTSRVLSESTDNSSASLYPILPQWEEKSSNNSASAQPLPTLTQDSTTFLPSSLSQTTTWTREHWLHLDALATERRRDPARFCAAHFPSASTSTAAPTSSHDSNLDLVLDLDKAFENHRLRGKEVAAQGASIILEPWHLEIVEAFRADLSGGGEYESVWDDAIIAKRLFALLVGEERRSAARRDRARRERDGARVGVR